MRGSPATRTLVSLALALCLYERPVTAQRIDGGGRINGTTTTTSITTLTATTVNATAVNSTTLTDTVPGITTTSTDGLVLTNTTDATVSVTDQWSPRLRLRGAAWKSNATAASHHADWIVENEATTGAAAITAPLLFKSSLNDAAFNTAATLTAGGNLTTTGSMTSSMFFATTNVSAGSSGSLLIGSRGGFSATADKQILQLDTGGTTGMELNVGTPTLGTCTAGSLTSGSHNFAGEITGNTSGSCVLNFGTPNYTNAPMCFAMSRTSTTHPRISAVAGNSITITGGVSGEAIGYVCVGRIGT